MRPLLLVTLVIVSFVQLGCTDNGADTLGPEPEVEVLDSSAPQRLHILLPVIKDVSGSENEDQAKEILPDVTDGIKEHSAAIDGVEVILFANRGRSIWQESRRKFIWGAAPRFKDFDETKILNDAPKSSKLFTQNKDEYLRRARKLYGLEKERFIKEYYARVDKALAEFKSYMLQQPDQYPDCTKFKSLGARIEKDTPDKCLCLSDGWADCADERSGNITPVELKGKLVIVQLTKKADSQADDEAFPRREGFLHALFPSAHIFRAYQAREALEYLFN